MMRRKLLAILLATVSVIGLGACAGMPLSGEVLPGLSSDAVDDAVDVAFQPAGPQPGATPQQIVEGFIAAGTSPADDWSIARLFLTPGAAQTWKPTAGVTIDDFVDRTMSIASDTSLSLTVSAVAAVDEEGTYSETDRGAVSLPFALEKQDDGQWRISSVTDGIVLDRDLFPRVFRAYSLMFFDPSWTFLVPDVRWFPARTNTAARIVQALIDGAPDTWLTGAVVSAFPDDVTAPEAVPNVDGVARVELPSSVLGLPDTQRDRMQAQLEASLASANIADAVMTVGSVDVTATPAVTRSTRIDSRAAVVTAGRFGLLSTDELQTIPGLSAGIAPLTPNAVEVSAGRDAAAVRLTSGEVLRVRADETNSVIDARPGLVAPSIDPGGYIWSVPSSRPSALVAFAPDGTSIPVADAWSGADRVRAMRLSRDGARIVAIVEAGGRNEVWVSGVVRDKGVPVRLAAWSRLATLPGDGVGIAWLDEVTVAAAATVQDGSVVTRVTVGGSSTESFTDVEASGVAGANDSTAMRVLAADGTLFYTTGARWQRSAEDISVLATQQGAPQ